MGAKRKSKISHVKRSNQLRTKLIKQGKLKTRRNRSITKLKRGTPVKLPQIDQEEEVDNDADVMDMVEEEDLKFLKKAVDQRRYSFVSSIQQELSSEKHRKRKRKLVDEGVVEESYEQGREKDSDEKKMRFLLPIKTGAGIVERVTDMKEVPDVEDTSLEGTEVKSEKDSDTENEVLTDDQADDPDKNKLMTTADMFASREELLKKKKFHIGILSTGLLENPEEKLKNFKTLLEMMDDRTPEIFITMRKLVCVSLLEVFKDLLPSYQIKMHDNPGVKLKKNVKQLHDFETGLLKAYKNYLVKLENMIGILRQKKGDTRTFKEAQLKLAETGIQCLCDLLITHPYFNFSKNITHLLIPYLECKRESIRTVVADAVKNIFKTDKRGEISLEIVRKINYLVKNKTINYTEVLQVFLSLRIKDVNLDEEKEEEIKEKKLQAKKQKLLQMSKREKKRKKRIQELEQELLETKAEENKKTKNQFLTEITKIVFMVYFRILKKSPNSKLLSVTLEGLAKFADCINFEFYHDLVNVLDNIIEESNIGYKEHNHCVQTVFTIVTGQGDALNIDPIRFYTHFYQNILQVHAGRNHGDFPVVLKTMDLVLLKRRNKISTQRLLAFTKRLGTLSLQLLHNSSLACLCMIKSVLQSKKVVEVLLDSDPICGQGTFSPDMNEPEYCNAGATSLWELLLLQRHYHPTVRSYAAAVAATIDKPESTMNLDVAKKTPYQLFVDFDPSNVSFTPAIPPPKVHNQSDKINVKCRIKDSDFEKYIQEILEIDNVTHFINN